MLLRKLLQNRRQQQKSKRMELHYHCHPLQGLFHLICNLIIRSKSAQTFESEVRRVQRSVLSLQQSLGQLLECDARLLRHKRTMVLVWNI